MVLDIRLIGRKAPTARRVLDGLSMGFLMTVQRPSWFYK